MVTGDHWANRVPPLRLVHLDSRSVVCVEALWASSLDQTTLFVANISEYQSRVTDDHSPNRVPPSTCCTTRLAVCGRS
eukprot:1947040-Pyramimonas_sp.AAC.1